MRSYPNLLLDKLNEKLGLNVTCRDLVFSHNDNTWVLSCSQLVFAIINSAYPTTPLLNGVLSLEGFNLTIKLK